jgi:hypothetical protein
MLAIERLSPSDLLYKYQSLATDELVDRACKSISENYSIGLIRQDLTIHLIVGQLIYS